MKNKQIIITLALLALAFSLQPSALLQAAPLGTAFTYQGRLSSGGNAATGLYDFSFALFNAASSGIQQGVTFTTNAVPVTNGYFMVMLDFGGAFDGNARWLDIAVKTNAAGSYSPLIPRQPLTPTPYAIMANSASNLLGTLPAAQLTGTMPSAQLGGTYSSAVTLNNAANTFNGAFSGNGANVTNVNAAAVGGLGVTSLWHLDGNNVAAGQFLGSTNNQPVELKVNNLRALLFEAAAIDVNHSNIVNLVGGSLVNYITPGVYGSVIVGGGAVYYGHTYSNSVSADFSFLGGGYLNSIQKNGTASFLGGGDHNTIQTNASASFLGGGEGNSIQTAASASFLGGGEGNSIQTNAYGSFLGGGYNNSIQTNANLSFLGGGNGNSIQPNANLSFIGGGEGNSIQRNAWLSFLGGGENNSIQTAAFASFLGGGENNSIQPNAHHSFLGGGVGNSVQEYVIYSFLGGGYLNSIQGGAQFSFLGGGVQNAIQEYANYSFLGGGEGNSIQADVTYSFLGGGVSNTVSGAGGFVGGGGYDGGSVLGNTASGVASVVVGGTQNIASGSRSTVGGGHNNSSTNWYATVPGGAWNLAGGQGSFAAGRAAKALHDGSFVWNDNVSGDLKSFGHDTVSMRASGGYRLYSSGSTGVSLAAGGGSWTSLSDRNAKENFSPVNAQAVLAKVTALPLTTWNYKSQAAAIRHIGPMAQDFKAAFGVGESDTGITTIDADGVALVAIQGLNQKLTEKEVEIQELKQRVAKLQKLVQTLVEKK